MNSTISSGLTKRGAADIYITPYQHEARWYTMDTDGDSLSIYYGAADCAIALAQASVRSLLDWLDANGSCERRQRARDL